MNKAIGSGADALILDLEDSVCAAHKQDARTQVVFFLERTPRPIPVFVRINPLESILASEDLRAIAAVPPDGIVLPKAEGSRSIVELRRLMASVSMTPVPILPIASETPAAVFQLSDYANASQGLAGLTWGAEDLPAAIGAATSREPNGQFTAPYEMVRALSLFAAHAAGVPAIETVYTAFRDLDGLAAYAARGARDGFSGMMAIHPSQVPLINAAFTPTAAAVLRAREVVAAFRDQPGAGVVDMGGVMLDAPHLKQAMRVLALVDGS